MGRGGEIYDDFLRRRTIEILLLQQARRQGLEAVMRGGVYRFREDAIIANAYANEVFGKKAIVTEEEVEARMPKHLATYKIRQIVLPSKEEAEAALVKLKGGADFVTLIQQESVGPEARKDGLLWDYREGQSSFWAKADEGYILDLPKGTYSRPIEMGIGWAIERVEEIKDPPPGMRERVKGRLRGTMRSERYQAEIDRRFKGMTFDVIDPGEFYKLVEKWWKSVDKKASDAVVGRYQGLTITFADIAELQETIIDTTGNPSTQDKWEKIKGMPAQLIKDHILAKEAREAGFTISPQMQEALDHFLNEAMILELERREVTPKVNVAEAELRPYFEANREAFDVKEAVRARQILVKEPVDAKRIMEDIKSGMDFTQLARENSLDPGSRTRGGDLGFVERGKYVKEFEDAAFSLKKDDEVYREPVKSPFGYHVIQRVERRQAKAAVFEEVRELVRKKMLKERGVKMRGEFAQALMANAAIVRGEMNIEAARGRFVADFDSKTKSKKMDFDLQHQPGKPGKFHGQ